VTPEERLVLSLATPPADISAPVPAAASQRASVDWSHVIELATKWEIEPVALKNLLALFSETLPEAIAVTAMECLREVQFYALSRTFVAVELQDAFERNGIPMIVLKGPAVGVVAYGDPTLRRFGDLDLFVQRSNLAAAKGLLAASGFSADYPAATEAALIREGTALGFSNAHVKIELHWSMFSAKWRCDLDPDLLFAQSRLVACLDQHLRVLGPDHLFVYLCAHNTRHEWQLLRWVCDIAQLARTYDKAGAERVLVYAERTHTRRIVALGLGLARDLFQADVAPFSPEDFARYRDIEGLIALVRKRLTSDRGAPASRVDRLAALHPGFFWIRSRERKSDQVVCFAQFLISRTPGDVIPGPRGLVARPFRLVSNAVRRLRLPAA
jgi:hypothetical protein